MSLSLNDIVSVSVNTAKANAVTNTFNIGLIIGQSNVISLTTRVNLYNQASDMLLDGFTTTSPEYLAAQLYFDQTPKPTKVAIGRWNYPTETAVQAVTACRLASNVWYACYICGAAKADILSVAPYIDSASPTSTFFYTTHDADVLAGTAGNIMQTLQSSNMHRTFGQYSNQFTTTSTAGYETGATGGSTNISAGTATTFKIAVDGGAATSVTLNVTGLTTGPLIAAAMQTGIQALGGSYAGVTVSYTNNVYVITSGTTGTSSSVAITAGSTNDVAATLKIGAINGAVDISGTSATIYADSAVSAMGYAMGANTGLSNSAYTLAYITEPGVNTENITETQLETIKGYNGNVLVNYGATYNILTQGTTADGTPFDSIINLDVLSNNIQIAIMNALQSAPKIPQTNSGISTLMNAIAGPCNQALNSGAIAPGIWNAASIGSLNTGDALPNGYVIMSDSLATQSAADRSARKAPNLYVAAKLAGAIEHVVVNVISNN
jgi:hypothetical protein